MRMPCECSMCDTTRMRRLSDSPKVSRRSSPSECIVCRLLPHVKRGLGRCHAECSVPVGMAALVCGLALTQFTLALISAAFPWNALNKPYLASLTCQIGRESCREREGKYG